MLAFRSAGTRLKQTLRSKFVALIESEKDPTRIAKSIALGFSVAVLPPFGGHTVLAIILSRLFKAATPIAVATVWINNPWTFIPVFVPMYIAETKLGGILLGVHPTIDTRSFHEGGRTAFAAVGHILVPFTLGSLIFAVPVYGFVYLAVLRITTSRQKKNTQTNDGSVPDK